MFHIFESIMLLFQKILFLVRKSYTKYPMIQVGILIGTRIIVSSENWEKLRLVGVN